MSSLTEYFAKRDIVRPKYDIGDRVYAKWNKIPVVASVLREENNQVLMQPDLPVKFNSVYHNILSVPVKDVKPLKEF